MGFNRPPSQDEKKKKLEEVEQNEKVDEIAGGADMSTNTDNFNTSTTKGESGKGDSQEGHKEDADDSIDEINKVSKELGVNEAVKKARQLDTSLLDKFVDETEDRSTVWDIYLQKTGKRHQNDNREAEESVENNLNSIKELREQQTVEQFNVRIYPIDIEIIQAAADDLGVSQRVLIEDALDILFKGKESALLEVIKEYRKKDDQKDSRLKG